MQLELSNIQSKYQTNDYPCEKKCKLSMKSLGDDTKDNYTESSQFLNLLKSNNSNNFEQSSYSQFLSDSNLNNNQYEYDNNNKNNKILTKQQKKQERQQELVQQQQIQQGNINNYYPHINFIQYNGCNNGFYPNNEDTVNSNQDNQIQFLTNQLSNNQTNLQNQINNNLISNYNYYDNENKYKNKKQLTATIVNLDDKKNKTQQQFLSNTCFVVLVDPPKLRNITSHYRIIDDFFMAEEQANIAHMTGDYEIVEPINSFKYVTFCVKNHITNTIQFQMQDRQNYNQPPLQYLVERFKSLNNQKAFQISKDLQKYIQVKNKFQELYKQNKLPIDCYKPENFTQEQKERIISNFVNKYNRENNLFMLTQFVINNDGILKLQENHLTTLLQKMFKVTEDLVIFSILKNGISNFRTYEEGFRQSLWVMDVMQQLIEAAEDGTQQNQFEKYINLEFLGQKNQKALYQELKETRIVTNGMVFQIIQLQSSKQIFPLNPRNLEVNTENNKEIKQFIESQLEQGSHKLKGFQ